MKNLLIFTEWYLPGYKAGGPIQSLVNLVSLLKQNYKISIISSDTDYLSDSPYPYIKSDTWTDMEDELKIIYISNKNKNIYFIKKLVDEALPDIVYLNSMYSFYYTILPIYILRNKSQVKIVLAPRGMLSRGSLSVKSTKKKIFFAITGLLTLFKNIIFHATSKQEEMDIKKIYQHNTTCTIPNIPSIPLTSFNKVKKEVGLLNLLMVARIAPEKNILYALEILTLVDVKVNLTLIGPIYNKEYWNECKSYIKKLPKNININFLNAISPNEIIDYYEMNHVFFLPSTGENFGHAIFNSLAHARPVIISDNTPWKKLDEQNCIFTAPLFESQEFVKHIKYFAALNQNEFDNLCVNSLNFANTYIKNTESKMLYLKMFG